MQIPQSVSNTTAGVFAPTIALFLQNTIKDIIPWLFVMFAVIIVDLMFGIRKSLKLGIHVSVSMAFRETMGKMVTYTAFVLMVCMIDEASGNSNLIAKWGCLGIAGIEGFSIIGNILKPYGVYLSPKAATKILVKKTVNADDADAEELVDRENVKKIRDREKSRWEKRRKRGQYGSHD